MRIPEKRAPPRRRELLKKICLLGDSGVGKKTIAGIVAPFERGIEKYTQTIGTAVTKYGLEFLVREQRIRLRILVWDVTGKEDYRRLHPAYYNGAEGVIVVGDAAMPDTVESMPRWIEAARAVAGAIPAVAIINKTDLVTPQALASVQRRALELLERFAAPVYLVNAGRTPKSALKIPFYELAKLIVVRASSPAGQ
ncbi:MAG: GTP-binding protein [Euryarchaeota archaeon]|nr:GTP-binding protein [Euryarchaeota archaeon]